MESVDLSTILLADIGEVAERAAAPAGFYDVKVIKADIKASKRGAPMIAVSYQIISSSNEFSLVNDWIMFPTSDMEPEMAKRRLLDLKRWCITFSVPADSTNVAVHMAIGKEASCSIVVEQDENGINRNRIRYPQFSADAELVAPSDADPSPFADMEKKKK